MRRMMLTLGILGAGSFAFAAEKNGVQWPQFRGPAASGVADGFATASEWDIDGGKGVKWKTPIPGLGLSSPVIWGDRVFVTTAVGEKGDASLKVGLYGDIQPVNEDFPHKFQVVCLDKKSGKILWTQTAFEGVPKVKRHTKASHANASAATDGKRVVAFFGSEGLYCYDMDGKPLWKKDLGLLESAYYRVPTAQWGFASSPVIFEDRVIVQADVLSGSFVGAFGLDDGRELWRTERTDVPTWSTPTVVHSGGRTQVLCNGYREMAGYDFATGKKLWAMAGGGDIPVPTPVVAGDLAYFASAHGNAAPIFAIRTDASGDLERPEPGKSSKHVAWHNGQVGVYMQTLLVNDGIVYGCRDGGILVAFDAKTGEQLYKERVGTGGAGFTASIVAADGKLYVTSEEGDVYIVKLGPKFERVGMSPLNEICMATPAISEGVLFFRTRGHVVAIGK
jgi:outer membrane protein assembly factor BamB